MKYFRSLVVITQRKTKINMELASLRLFDKDPLIIEINEMEEYINLLEEELSTREGPSLIPTEILTFDDEKGFLYSDTNVKLKSIENKKIILQLRSEISSKKIFLEELRSSLLRNKEVVHAEYEEFKNTRQKLFDNLNKLSESGYKTEVHKAWFTYLRTNLSIYEKMLVDHNEDKHKITTDTGIKEGIVYFYTQLLYAIDEHQKYRQ